VGWVGSVTTENSAVRPYPHPLDSFGFPSALAEGTDTGHREKVEIHRPNCLTVAVTQRARQGPFHTVVLEIGLTDKHLIIIFLTRCQDLCLNILLSRHLLNEGHCTP
jgi:hypothetical protein